MPGDPLLLVGCWLVHRDAPYNYSTLRTRVTGAVDENASHFLARARDTVIQRDGLNPPKGIVSRQ
jgi:hypothetical protein